VAYSAQGLATEHLGLGEGIGIAQPLPLVQHEHLFELGEEQL
jgi:hypothetical protein